MTLIRVVRSIEHATIVMLTANVDLINSINDKFTYFFLLFILFLTRLFWNFQWGRL